jgi:hypothetical protein
LRATTKQFFAHGACDRVSRQIKPETGQKITSENMIFRALPENGKTSCTHESLVPMSFQYCTSLGSSFCDDGADEFTSTA